MLLDAECLENNFSLYFASLHLSVCFRWAGKSVDLSCLEAEDMLPNILLNLINEVLK